MKNIDRRRFLQLAGGGTLAAGVLASSGCSTLPTAQQARPNIVFLLTDDQRWDTLGCMGNPIVRTPNMDHLANNGVLFSNAFVTTSICCSSRASIFTGQYSRRHGVHNFSTPFSQEALVNTYPMLLRSAGYRTGFIGKYGVGGAKDLPVDKYDYFKGFAGQGKYEHKDAEGNYKHLTSMMGDQALEFLQGCTKGQPFCLSVSFKAPHCQDGDPRQFIYDRALEDLYKDDTIPLPETATEDYFNRLPDFLRNSEARNRWKIRFADEQMRQNSVKAYYRLITGVDNAIGRIRAQLGQSGLADNTVIILIGDNGFYLGEHGLAGKWFGHEESVRVPLFIYDPRVGARRRGQRRSEIALNIDIAPTILGFAGVDAPKGMHGRDLSSPTRAKTKKRRKDFLYEHLFAHPAIAKSEGVIGGRYKYLRYIEREPVYEELYDLQTDPHETRNLAGNVEYRRLLEDLRKRCNVLIEEAKG